MDTSMVDVLSRELRIGIIGCGVIAACHVDSYLALDGVRVTAVCDLREDRMADLCARYPQLSLRRFRDAEALLASGEIDVVSICTDHASHEALLLAALRHGCHAICEKALTTNMDSLQRMVEAAAGSSRITAGILQHRFDPIYAVVRDALAQGSLGTLLTASGWHQCLRTEAYYRADAWRGTWTGEGGSLLINQSIHFLDILQWVSGPVESVAAEIANRVHGGIIETEDTAGVSLRFCNGVLGTFTATSGSHRTWTYGFRWVGADGEIELRDGRLLACSHRDEALAAALGAQLQAATEPPAVASAKDYYGTGHPAQIRDFVDAIRLGRPPRVSLADAAQAVRLVLAIYAAAASGKHCRLQ